MKKSSQAMSNNPEGENMAEVTSLPKAPIPFVTWLIKKNGGAS